MRMYDSILTIGCSYKPPKGGIAMVLSLYDKEIYSPFKFIANSCEGSKPKKIFFGLFGLVKLLLALIFDKSIKVVHIHTASGRSFVRSTYFMKLSKMFKKKVVMHIHGGNFMNYYSSSPKFVAQTLKQCDVLVALTKTWQTFFQNEVGHKNVVIINNVIEQPQINITHERNDSKIHLLFLGLICQDKGIYDLVEILRQHKTEFQDKLCVHIGGNGEVEKLQKLVEDNGLSDVIIYEGWVSGSKKVELFNTVDALILPSYIEGLPMVILEAMSYGLPILSSKVGGIPEIVDEKNAFLFTPGDLNEIYKVMSDFVMLSAKQRMKMQEVSIDKSKDFLTSTVKCRLESMYKSMQNL